MEYRYILERYRPGGSNRYQCPKCGKRKCFTRYVDNETSSYLADLIISHRKTVTI